MIFYRENKNGVEKELEAELERARERGDFIIYYVPIFIDDFQCLHFQ